MKRVHAASLAALLLIAMTLVSENAAQAGTFTMKQCSGASQLDFQGTYSSINTPNPRVDVDNGCSTSGSGMAAIYQDRRGGNLNPGEGGLFRWTAAPGTTIIGAEITARMLEANSVRADVVASNGSSIIPLDSGLVKDGREHTFSWAYSGNPQTVLLARLYCNTTGVCPNQSNVTRASMLINDMELAIRDGALPGVSASGTLWSWAGDGQHHRAGASITLSANDDGSGIAGLWIEVNGLKVDLPGPSCPGDKGSYATRFTPCPLSHSASRSFDTASAPFQEGQNTIRVCARDYAISEASAGRSCSATRTVLIDNQPPNPPTDLRSDQGSGWRAENGFTLRWEVPGGQVSPIIGAAYRVLDSGTGTLVASGYVGEAGITSIGPLELPDIGEYRASVNLIDGGFNIGQPAETTLRFDDRPPGDVDPEPADGWVSKDELPLAQEIEKAEPGGPSGVSGYAIAASSQGPAQPCSSAICLAPELSLSGGPDSRVGLVGGLTEGSHWISAVAVSGALKASAQPGSTVVKVDRTAPEAEISGIPNEWVNHAVTVSVEARDRLSGMMPEQGDEGRPKTVIQAGDYAAYETPGPIANFAVATEGVNRVRFWAEDLAGNANDGMPGTGGDIHPPPGQAVVRIDMTAPTAFLREERDEQDPELVHLVAEDMDSGVASASIELRQAGFGDEYRTLETKKDEGGFVARVPSDDLAPGSYELRYRVLDRAGNTQTGNRTEDGEPMILNLPLKDPTRLVATFSQGSKSARSAYGSREILEGRLSSGEAGVSNQKLNIVEKYWAGAKMDVKSTEVTTDGTGRFRLRLPAGPSRSISVSFGGSRKLARADGPKLNLSVGGKTVLRTRPTRLHNGGIVRMKGKVGYLGALPPARGKLVAIQFLDPERRKWRPVEVLRTNRQGRFRFAYRFRTITSAQRIIFRAQALPEAGWPYLPSTSKRKSVIVLP